MAWHTDKSNTINDNSHPRSRKKKGAVRDYNGTSLAASHSSPTLITVGLVFDPIDRPRAAIIERENDIEVVEKMDSVSGRRRSSPSSDEKNREEAE